MSYQDEARERGASFLDTLAAKSDVPLTEVATSHRQRLVSLEIGELLTYSFPFQEPLLGPWLRKQTLAMVHAWRGVGKTHFALGVAYAVASGGKFLKWQAD